MKYLRYGSVDGYHPPCLKGGDTLRLENKRPGEQSLRVLAAVR